MQLSEEKTEASVQAIANIASSTVYLANAISAAFEMSIVAPKCQKTRRLKDQRLDQDKYVLCLESGFVSGIRAIEAAKKAAAEAKSQERELNELRNSPLKHDRLLKRSLRFEEKSQQKNKHITLLK